MQVSKRVGFLLNHLKSKWGRVGGVQSLSLRLPSAPQDEFPLGILPEHIAVASLSAYYSAPSPSSADKLQILSVRYLLPDRPSPPVAPSTPALLPPAPLVPARDGRYEQPEMGVGVGVGVGVAMERSPEECGSGGWAMGQGQGVFAGQSYQHQDQQTPNALLPEEDSILRSFRDNEISLSLTEAFQHPVFQQEHPPGQPRESGL
jgi:hypothetical protein